MQWYVTALYFSRKHTLKLSCETCPQMYRMFVFMLCFLLAIFQKDVVFYIVNVLFFVKSLKSPFHALCVSTVLSERNAFLKVINYWKLIFLLYKVLLGIQLLTCQPTFSVYSNLKFCHICGVVTCQVHSTYMDLVKCLVEVKYIMQK